VKRPFFCGLAAILILDGIVMLSGHIALTRATSTWVGIVILVTAGLSVWMAIRSSRSKSWWVAILLWIAGFAIGSQVLVPVFYFLGEMPTRP
jgi:uncharacterized membrane protein HdeD (DUF308 family)